ncbi:MAG: shikimate dehydrogenase [Phycisphaeraceae bacterium]|nr:shikimate dehydrogenase [Phycisphaeraceae bacterium]
MTKLCVPIMVDSADQALADAHAAKAAGADLVELRLDRFSDDRIAAAKLVGNCPLPTIVTIRPNWEGGDYDGDDMHRIALFEYLGVACAGQGPAYFDVELATYDRSANLRQKVMLVVDHPGQPRLTDTGLILSSHDFNTRPPDLIRRIKTMADYGSCRVVKLAWAARSLRDNLEAFEVIEQRHKPTIALCMGEHGLMSRVLAKKFGALLTFAAIDDAHGTAPGQPTIHELKSLYRWDALNADTQVFGVIGDPVGHSMSPAIHNAGFDGTNYDGVYLPMRIPPEYEHFKATVGSFLAYESLHFRGASVTIPHKHNLLRFVEEMQGEIEPLAAQIGAANTLTVRDDGSLYASNTDYAAALDSVCDALKIQRDALQSKRVAVLGAGGAARAVVAGFTAHNAEVTVFNRTLDKADTLAEGFDAHAAAFDDINSADFDILINCTPIGMHPNEDATPYDVTSHPSPATSTLRVVFDTIYNPVETKLLREAKAAGCITVSGVEMFVRQAAAQFELWTGQPAPSDRFRQVVLDRLNT